MELELTNVDTDDTEEDTVLDDAEMTDDEDTLEVVGADEEVVGMYTALPCGVVADEVVLVEAKLEELVLGVLEVVEVELDGKLDEEEDAVDLVDEGTVDEGTVDDEDVLELDEVLCARRVLAVTARTNNIGMDFMTGKQ